MTSHCFTVYRGATDGSIIKTETSLADRPLVNDEVYVRVTHSGVCGSDLHCIPLQIALGHEGIGVVDKLGPNVKRLQIYLRELFRVSCWETLSVRIKPGLWTDGRSQLRKFRDRCDSGRESFLLKIPDTISSEYAAPLMCAGATVWALLFLHDVKPNEIVGSVGIGGVGHLAIQFARAMDCTVIVFSQTESKKQQALELGASKFLDTKGKGVKELLKTLRQEGPAKKSGRDF